MAGACRIVPIAGTTVVGDGEETHLLLKYATISKGKAATSGTRWFGWPGFTVVDSDGNIFVGGGSCADSSLLIQIGLDCETEYRCSGQGQWSILSFYSGHQVE